MLRNGTFIKVFICFTAFILLPLIGNPTLVHAYSDEVKTPQYKAQVGKEIVKLTSKVYTYSQMIKDMNSLKKQYPGLVTIKSIGKSVLGKELQCLIVGKESSPNKILIIGSTHAREYLTTQLVMKQIDYVLQNYEKGIYKTFKIKNIFTDTAIYYVPMLNPDGVTLSQLGINSVSDANLRKKLISLNHGSSNFSKWKSNIKGVDLNRNFSMGWKSLKTTKPGSAEYKGPKPESEPETRAIANFIRTNKFKTLVCYHVTGSIIYWYNGQRGTVMNRDYAIAKNLSSITGYKLVPASQSTTSGGLKDWYIPTFKNPAFTIEVGKAGSSVPLAFSQFSDIWKRNKDVPIYLATLYSKNLPPKEVVYENLIKNGNSYMAKGKYADAIKSYDEAIKLNNNAIEAYYNKSIALYKLNKLDESLDALNIILSKNKNMADVYYDMACIYSLQERSDESLANLRHAIELNKSLKARAIKDDDFNYMKELPEFMTLIGE